MKIKNIFKKSEKVVAKANVQKLEKNQLEKVIGGADDTSASNTSDPSSSTDASKVKRRSISVIFHND